jgi:hypothetical protein
MSKPHLVPNVLSAVRRRSLRSRDAGDCNASHGSDVGATDADGWPPSSAGSLPRCRRAPRLTASRCWDFPGCIRTVPGQGQLDPTYVSHERQFCQELTAGIPLTASEPGWSLCCQGKMSITHCRLSISERGCILRKAMVMVRGWEERSLPFRPELVLKVDGCVCDIGFSCVVSS